MSDDPLVQADPASDAPTAAERATVDVVAALLRTGDVRPLVAAAGDGNGGRERARDVLRTLASGRRGARAAHAGGARPPGERRPSPQRRSTSELRRSVVIPVQERTGDDPALPARPARRPSTPAPQSQPARPPHLGRPVSGAVGGDVRALACRSGWCSRCRSDGRLPAAHLHRLPRLRPRLVPAVQAGERVARLVAGRARLLAVLSWRHSHAVHHATAGDLDRRGVGDVRTLTMTEYRAASWRGRLATACSATRW